MHAEGKHTWIGLHGGTIEVCEQVGGRLSWYRVDEICADEVCTSGRATNGAEFPDIRPGILKFGRMGWIVCKIRYPESAES